MTRPAPTLRILLPAVAVAEHRLRVYKNSWQGSAFSTFLFPVLLLAGVGMGVGPFVDSGDRLATDYLSFLAPGLLAATVFQLAVTEATFPLLANLKWNRVFQATLATPVGIRSLLLGDLAGLVLRLLLAAGVFLGVMAGFGLTSSPLALLCVPVAGLLGLAVASSVYAFTVAQDSAHYFPVLQRFGVMPIALFSGVFFPIEQLPAVLAAPVTLSPLWHAVELCRAVTAGQLETGLVGNLAYLLGWGAVGCFLADRLFRRRLVL